MVPTGGPGSVIIYKYLSALQIKAAFKTFHCFSMMHKVVFFSFFVHGSVD